MTKNAPKTTPQKRKPKFVWRKRDAQDSRQYNLQLDINDIKQQIQELNQARLLLRTQELTRQYTRDGAYMHTVVEYLRVFRNGIDHATVDVPAFLTHIMASDVWINDMRGNVDMMLAQWKLYSHCFSDIDLRYKTAFALPIHDDSGREGFVVRATAHYHARLTNQTIAIMFPHLLRFPSIAVKLVGRVMEGFSSYDFVFDCHTHRILRCDVTMDMVSAFATLLKSPEAVNFVFNGAKFESDFYILDDHCHRANEVESVKVIDSYNGRPLTNVDSVPPLNDHKMTLNHILC